MISGPVYTAFSVKQWSCILLSILIQLFSWQTCYGDERTEAIKTAYLYNFAKFTHWHDISEGADLHIQIIGNHPFGKSLSPLASKNIKKHPITISTLENYNPEQPPHILFIASSKKSSLHSILNSVAGKQVLTVSDMLEFTDNGGMIELIEKGNNIRFRINLDAARKSGVDLSSQMLRLADSIINNSSGAK
jgi:uncharacterized protein DUF4154